MRRMWDFTAELCSHSLSPRPPSRGAVRRDSAGRGTGRRAPPQARCAAMTSPRRATAPSITAGEWVTKLSRIVERSAWSA